MNRYFFRLSALLALPALMLVGGCDRHDPEDHALMDRVIIETRGVADPVTVAEWTRTDGWNVDNLPTLTVGDETDNWGRSSWTVRIFEGGQELPMATIEDPGPGQPRVCSEYSARYSVVQTSEVLYDPGEDGIVTVGGAPRNTFHCDHIHVYPQSAGTAQIRIVLWHVDHADGRTDPIAISVQG
jgi:hypothetical protein